MTGPAKDDPLAAHAQAQARIDGIWRWLCIDGFMVFICEQEKFNPDKAWSVKEFMETFFYHR